MNRSCMFSLRLSLDLLDKLETASKQKNENLSKTIRYFIELGFLADSFKTSIQNPEFLKSINELKQNDGIFQWLETLTDPQADAIAYALQVEKEKRYGQRNLR